MTIISAIASTSLAYLSVTLLTSNRPDDHRRWTNIMLGVLLGFLLALAF